MGSKKEKPEEGEENKETDSWFKFPSGREPPFFIPEEVKFDRIVHYGMQV